MAELIAAGVSVVTVIAVVAAIFQVESHPKATNTIATQGASVINTTVQQLFK